MPHLRPDRAVATRFGQWSAPGRFTPTGGKSIVSTRWTIGVSAITSPPHSGYSVRCTASRSDRGV
ncbi:hypothetical protein [Isoptericola croceus]|uniref:hypothetical protein n=1 Tax=Isoptericola croceus TaxID=3031406 RepID=UPI0023F932A7|nr:hypothetical protein [Isoptericola croceus]